MTSSIVKFELVKLTSLSNIDRESLIEPSDFSAIISNELSSNFIFFSLHILLNSPIIELLSTFLKS